MTVARTLATFLTQVTYQELPPQTVEHAAMLIASTVASAACGTGIESAAIIRDLAIERGGTPPGIHLVCPGVTSQIAGGRCRTSQCGDERCRRL